MVPKNALEVLDCTQVYAPLAMTIARIEPIRRTANVRCRWDTAAV